ncbi:YesL family protein [Halobacillus salinarum]|uniref:YesL family protein n=1 Tax=Halobacillus salinarum TaxID=2932257 RepID=A0ABY4EHM5_9BACI|nr:YesL family protein [Halobacillus salinarum]UOQ43973.1 YesL family protein [Halobacillus salinarum]
MQMGRLLTGVLAFCHWVTHFALLNLMWAGCTLLGGVIFGIGPSTVAMYSVTREVVTGDEEVKLFSHFWKTFRQEFFRANGLAVILIFLGLLCYFDLQFFRQFEGEVYHLLSYVMVLASLSFIIMLVYLLPVYVHFRLTIFQSIKQALFIGFLRPANLVISVVTALTTYYFFIYFPGFIPLFGFTLFAHLNMWLSMKCFTEIEEMKMEQKAA